MCIFAFGPSLSPFNSFLMLLIHSAFFIMFTWLPYFTPKLFSFPCLRLLLCLRAISPYSLVEFAFIVWEYPILSALFYPISISFNFPSFRFISPSCIVIFSCIAFSFCPNMFQHFSFVQSFCLFSEISYLRFQSNLPSRFWFSIRVL